MDDSQGSVDSKDDSSKDASRAVEYNHWNCSVKRYHDDHEASKALEAAVYDREVLTRTSGLLKFEIEELERALSAQGGDDSSHPEVKATLEQLRRDREANNRRIDDIGSQIKTLQEYLK